MEGFPKNWPIRSELFPSIWYDECLEISNEKCSLLNFFLYDDFFKIRHCVRRRSHDDGTRRLGKINQCPKFRQNIFKFCDLQVERKTIWPDMRHTQKSLAQNNFLNQLIWLIRDRSCGSPGCAECYKYVCKLNIPRALRQNWLLSSVSDKSQHSQQLLTTKCN